MNDVQDSITGIINLYRESIGWPHCTASHERSKFRAAHRMETAELTGEESLDAFAREKVETEIAAYIQLHTKYE
jgi:hypothetical protein